MKSNLFSRSDVMSLELSTGVLMRPSNRQTAPRPRRAHVLVRLHGHPLGTIDVDTSQESEIVEKATNAAWLTFSHLIESHLRADGLKGGDAINQAMLSEDIQCENPVIHNDHSPQELFITVSIATRDNEEACCRCVQLMLEMTYAHFEILVVDNASVEGGLAGLLREKFGDNTQVRYVREPQKGLSRARNRAIREAHGDVVVFTDDDIIPDGAWLDAIADAFASDPAVSCVTGPILAAEMQTPAQWWLEQYGGYNKGFQRNVYDLQDNRRLNKLYPYDAGRFGSGANMAFKVKDIRDLGGFADDLGAGTPTHGGEDIDILCRTITSGRRLVYEPAAMIWHHHRESYVALRRQIFFYGIGFSSTVMKWILDDPRTAWQIVRRLPAGAAHVFHPDSTKNNRKSVGYPQQLTRLERLGMAVGPFVYLWSRLRNR